MLHPCITNTRHRHDYRSMNTAHFARNVGVVSQQVQTLGQELPLKRQAVRFIPKDHIMLHACAPEITHHHNHSLVSSTHFAHNVGAVSQRLQILWHQFLCQRQAVGLVTKYHSSLHTYSSQHSAKYHSSLPTYSSQHRDTMPNITPVCIQDDPPKYATHKNVNNFYMLAGTTEVTQQQRSVSVSLGSPPTM